MRRFAGAIGLAVALSASAACGPTVDVKKLTVVETFTGWYDDGPKNGLNRLVPSVTFRLKNDGPTPANRVQLTVAFWKDGDDGEWDGREIMGIGPTPIEPGATTEPLLVRATVAYTLQPPSARDDLFVHSMFKDVTARIIAKRDGNIERIAEVRIDRRILPHLEASAGQ